LYTAQFRQLPGIANCCPGFDGGRGTGVMTSLIAEYPWLPYAWLSGQLGYVSLSGELAEQEGIGNVALIDAQGDTVVQEAEVEHVLRASVSAAVADIGISSRFFGRFSIRVGTNVAVLLSRRFRQYEQLVSPEEFVFAREGSRRRNEYEGDIPKAPFALLGVGFSVGYTLPIGRTWELVPTFHYTFSLTNLSSVPWKPSALRLGISILRTLLPPPAPMRDTVYRRDTTVIAVAGLSQEELALEGRQMRTDTLAIGDRPLYRTTVVERWQRRIPKVSLLRPTVQIVLPDTATTLLVEELEQEEAFPLLPYVFFPEGSAELERTRMHLLTPAEGKNFRTETLPMQTLQVYYHLLNIVGERLQRFPAAELTVTGCVSNVGVELGNRELAQRRAEAVRDYLIRVWRIEPRRIRVQARLLPSVPSNPETPEGQEENRRVELSSSIPDILAPVFLTETGYVVTPETLLVRSTVEAENSIALWELTVSHGEHTLFSKVGTGSPPQEVAVYAVPAILSRGDYPIRAELRVVDATHNQGKASSELSFRRLSLRQKRSERIGNERRERFALTLFEYDKATLAQEHQRILSLVRQRIQPNTRVVIKGYTDRTGDPVYNRKLAEQRCRNVWQGLNLRATVPEIHAIGSDVLLYPNELPEGRAYSRTVHIELITPVD